MLPAVCWTVTGDAERSSRYKDTLQPKQPQTSFTLMQLLVGRKNRAELKTQEEVQGKSGSRCDGAKPETKPVIC